jgi:hypothetical protein
MRRKNLFLSLSPNKRNYKVGIYEGSSIVILGTVFIVAHNNNLLKVHRYGDGNWAKKYGIAHPFRVGYYSL